MSKRCVNFRVHLQYELGSAYVSSSPHLLQVEKPTDEQISELLETYTAALVKLFDDHKAKYCSAGPEAKLTVI
jgi:hypothetical protein